MSVGKRIGSTLYVHRSAFGHLPSKYIKLLGRASMLLIKEHLSSYNVVKIDVGASKVSFLEYESFCSDPFPALRAAINIEVITKNSRVMNYRDSKNPPILHRKELLIPPDHPCQELFSELTRELDALRLYYEVHKIGHFSQWADRLAHAGVGIVDHHVVKLSDSPTLSAKKPW